MTDAATPMTCTRCNKQIYASEEHLRVNTPTQQGAPVHAVCMFGPKPLPQLQLIDDGHVEKLERDREFEVDYTPSGVVRQGLDWLANYYAAAEGWPPLRVLDPCAGAGVFGQQAKKVWPALMLLTGVEPRSEEHDEGNILRNYSDTVHGLGRRVGCTAQEYAAESSTGYDITATNPPFTLWDTILRLYLPRSKWVMLYGTISWGCSEEGNATFAEHPPFACGRVVGRVHHRGPGLNPETGRPWGADQRDVCWWLWKSGHTMPTWSTENLAPLTAAERRWTAKPGSETP